MNQRQMERGGVLTFVIVGVVLTLLLTSGILLAKQQARVARSAGAPETTVNQPEKPSTPSTNDDQKGSDTEPNNGTPVTTLDNTNNTPPNNNTTGRLPVSGPSEIPSAGPEDILLSLVSLTLVSAAGYAHVKSQKSLRASALK